MRLVIDTDRMGPFVRDCAAEVEKPVMRAVARELDRMARLYLDEAENPTYSPEEAQQERAKGERMAETARGIRWAIREAWTVKGSG